MSNAWESGRHEQGSGCANLDLCALADGRLGLAYLTGLDLFASAAGAVIAHEAGVGITRVPGRGSYMNILGTNDESDPLIRKTFGKTFSRMQRELDWNFTRLV